MDNTNKTLIVIISIIITFPLLLLSTTQSMINAWIVDGTYNHAFLVFPVCIWLIYQRKDLLLSLKPKPDLLAIAFLPGAIIILFLALIVDVQIAQQVAMITIIITTIWAMFGREITLTLIFPLLFLYFAAPLGSSLIPVLMEFTAHFVVFMVKLTGIPVYSDGLYFSLPTGSWSVIEACSGIRYLIASFSLGIIYAYITYTSTKKRIIFILFAIITPIIANGLRAFGIVMIGHFSDMKYATGVDHLMFGWLFFGVIIFTLFFIGNYWADPPPANKQNNTSANTRCAEISKYSYVILAVTVFILIITQASAAHIKSQEHGKINNTQITLPSSLADWHIQEKNILDWEPTLTNPDAVFSRTFIKQDNIVQLSIGYYSNQKQGGEAISSMNRISSLFGTKWKKITGTKLNINNLDLNETIIKDNKNKLLVWDWYRVGRFQTANPYLAKVYNAYNLIFENRNDASFISIATPLLNVDKSTSRETLKKFISQFQNKVDYQLEHLHDL